MNNEHRNNDKKRIVCYRLLAIYLIAGLLFYPGSPKNMVEAAGLLGAPVANDDSGPGFITDEDSPFIVGDVLANDYDPDGDPLEIFSVDTSATLGEVYTPSGGFDLSFSENGWASVDFFNREDYPYSLLLQPDGRLILSGYTREGTTNRDFAMARFNLNGSLDPTFGTGGLVSQDFGGREYYGVAALQPDGKIIIGGQRATNTYECILARLNPDGSLDTTFGAPNGYVLTNMDGSDEFLGVARQSDGKIVAAGSTYVTDNYDMVIARYNDDGGLDTTFAAPNGYRVVSLPFDQFTNAMLLQADGSIVLIGYTNSLGGHDFFLARFTPTGDLDPTFGSGGVVVTQISIYFDHGEGLVQQTDGKLIAVGVSNNSLDTDVVVARYNPDGSLDTSFGSNGLVVTDLGSYEDATSVAIEGEQIVVVGESLGNFLVARYDASGSLDPTFGDGGVLIADLGATWEYATDVVIQPDGRIVAGGVTRPGTYDDFAIARFSLGFSIFYDPASQFDWLGTGEAATDTFDYVVSDGVLTDTATVSITVNGVNDHPIAINQNIYLDEDTSYIGQLTATDIDSDVLTFGAMMPPEYGEVSIDPSGVFTYTPDLNYNGGDYFGFYVSDGNLIDEGIITVSVNPINDPPDVYAGLDINSWEGNSIQFWGVYTDTGVLSTVDSITWDFGDGTVITGTTHPIHAYIDNDIYTVTLTVDDGMGGVGSDWLLAVVENIAPQLDPIDNQKIPLGTLLTVTTVFSDPGVLDTHTVTIDWNDGITETFDLPAGVLNFDLTHTYNFAGEFSCTLQVSDKDGSADMIGFQVQVIQTSFKIRLPIVWK